MNVKQIATILNDTINKEQLGESAVVQEDLSNIVDVGKTVLDYTGSSNTNYDNFIRSLIDQVGKVTFVDRVYTSKAPAIVKDSWEYGSILMKVRAEIPDAADNESWNLANKQNGDSIDPFVITKPEVSAKFYNSKTTFEIPITIAEVQLKEAFRSASEMNRFISMIQNRIALKATLSTDAMIQRTINNLMAQKIGAQNNVVNLLAEYNATLPASATPITAAEAYQDRDFLKFATKTIMLYKKFLANASTLYNAAGYVTFTPESSLKFITLSDFAKSMEVYLLSETYNREFVTLPGYSEVPYWQGSGTGANQTVTQRSKLTVKTLLDGSASAVSQDGVVAVMFDDQAAAVCNENSRVTSIYNPKGEYWNYFYKYDCSYMNDVAENCVVFVIADATE